MKKGVEQLSPINSTDAVDVEEAVPFVPNVRNQGEGKREASEAKKEDQWNDVGATENTGTVGKSVREEEEEESIADVEARGCVDL